MTVPNLNYYKPNIASTMKSITNKLVLPLCMLLLGACSRELKENYTEEPVTRTLKVRGISVDGTGSAPDGVDVFMFTGGKKYKTSLLDFEKGGDVTVFDRAGLYFFAGQRFPDHSDDISEDLFRTITIGEAIHDNSAPEFYAAVVECGETRAGGDDLVVNIKRGVARIDLDTSADGKTQISEVIVEDAPEETLPFCEGTAAPSGRTVKYTKNFETPFSGRMPGLFRIFESSRPVNISLKGSYDGVPVSLRMALPVIERSKVYTLEVLNAGSSQSVQFTVSDWEEGDTVTGKPDISHRLKIDEAHSVIPEGVAVDFENNTVSVPASGAEGMKLAFLSETAVTLAAVDGNDADISLGGITSGYEGDKVLSLLPLDIAPQRNGRLAYSFSLHLKKPSLAQAYDFVDVRVEQSPTQIPTVEIGGSVWMAFNARSRDLDDQVYPLDGAGVEEMYRDAWTTTVGGLFQFGRKYMYVPWQGYRPSDNLGNQKQDKPWQHDTHMPCPDGYRIPTRDELRALLPSGTTVPGTYTAGNGEQITATLHAGEGTLSTPTGVTGTQRYLKLTSGVTGHSLILPLAGYKGDKSTAASPGFGRSVALWTDAWGTSGGYAWMFLLDFGSATGESAAIVEKQYQMEGFCAARCVKI